MMSDRLFKLISLGLVCALIAALAVLKYLSSEALIAAVVTLIYAVVDVFKSVAPAPAPAPAPEARKGDTDA